MNVLRCYPARKTGEYIATEGKHEMYGSEYVFRLSLRASYDKMLRTAPLTRG